jgi:hypothetical protein
LRGKVAKALERAGTEGDVSAIAAQIGNMEYYIRGAVPQALRDKFEATVKKHVAKLRPDLSTSDIEALVTTASNKLRATSKRAPY